MTRPLGLLRQTIASLTFGRVSASEPSSAADTGASRVFGDGLEAVQDEPEMVMTLGDDLVVRYANPAVERVLGYAPGAFVGTGVLAHVHPGDTRPALQGLGPSGGRVVMPTPSEFRMRHADGAWRHVQATIINPLDAGRVDRAYYVRDVTRGKTLENELKSWALLDPLTGLANRRLFMDRLDHALVRSVRRQQAVSVLFLDVDDFKAINDALGHEAGDRLLVTVARRLRACSRPEDTVARFGGDEFVVLLEDGAGPGRAVGVAERITRKLRSPVALDGDTLYVTASIGVASSGPGLQSADDLLHAADTAMYSAKENARPSYEVFESNMSEAARQRLKMEGDLRRAIEREEFGVHYQPAVLLGTGRIAGMEALLRWDCPHHGLVSPAEFIESIERTGLIVPIGRWILERACRQATEWRERFPGASPWVSVNLSARQFRQPGLVQMVDGVLRSTGLDPEVLVLEITESLVMEDTQQVLETLRRLKDLGVRLAIDDFGTGYSSLAYLEQLPADLLKVDQSFVDRLGREGASATTLVSALVAVSKAFGIEAVAEGVETGEQLRELREMECELGQGYYFSRPLPADEASALLDLSNEAGSNPTP